MKDMAYSLRDLGELIVDCTLVLNLLRGLSPCYDDLKALIKQIVPFPSFHAVRNELLEELTLVLRLQVKHMSLMAQGDGEGSSGSTFLFVC